MDQTDQENVLAVFKKNEIKNWPCHNAVFALNAQGWQKIARPASFPVKQPSFPSFSCLKVVKAEIRSGKFSNLNALIDNVIIRLAVLSLKTMHLSHNLRQSIWTSHSPLRIYVGSGIMVLNDLIHLHLAQRCLPCLPVMSQRKRLLIIDNFQFSQSATRGLATLSNPMADPQH